MRLIIVRHGETLWNKELRLQGQKDIPISEYGLKQAKMLAKRLGKENIDIIYTSRLKRAVETANQIKRFHKNAKMIKEMELNEMSWGIWEGLKMDFIKKKYKRIYREREKNKFNFKIPEGESPKMLKARVKKVLSKIIKSDKNRTILIVGHGGVNRAIMGLLLKWSDKKVLSTRLYNASITILNIKNNRAIMRLFNSNHHLKNGNLQS